MYKHISKYDFSDMRFELKYCHIETYICENYFHIDRFIQNWKTWLNAKYHNIAKNISAVFLGKIFSLIKVTLK